MKRLFLCLFLLFFMSGCGEKKIIDDINIVIGVGFDKASDKKMIGTFLTQNFKPDKSTADQTYTSEATLRRDLVIKAKRQSNQPLVTGGLGITVIGEELGNHGIKDILDVYQRDVAIGARNFLAISEGKAQKILQGQYGTLGTGIYLYNLLESNIKSNDLPRTNLHLFLHDYYQKGKDIYLPRLKQISADQVEISGISLFKEDKVVDVVPSEKMFFFRLLVDKYSKGNTSVPKEQNGMASIKSIRSKHKFIISNKNPNQVTIKIEIKGAIQEFTGQKLNQHVIKEVREELEKEVEEECSKLVRSFQEKGIDPLGFGQFYKGRNRNFDFKKWEENYKNLEVKIVCDVIIVDTGIIS